MDVLNDSRLSVIPIKTRHTHSQMMLICDKESRYFFAVTVPDGKVVKKFRLKKEFMNENYLRLISQLNDATFVFAYTQYYGAWKSDLRVREHGAMVYNFKTDQHNTINFSVMDTKVVATNNSLVLVDTKTTPNRWQVYTFESNGSQGLEGTVVTQFGFFEPPQLKDHYASYVSRCGKTNESSILYFNQKPGEHKRLDKIAVVKLNDALKMAESKEFPVAPFIWYNCHGDSDLEDGWPTGKLLNLRSLKLFGQKDNLLCFADVDQDESNNSGSLKCKGIWLLILDWPNDPKWKHVSFEREKIVPEESCLVINEENEVYVVHDNNVDNYHMTFLTHLQVPSLKHLGAKQVLSKPVDVVQEEQTELPKGCLTDAPWLNRPTEPNFTFDEKRSVVICHLTKDEFPSFCSKRLGLSKDQTDDTVIESVISNTPRKLTVKFHTIQQKIDFLNKAKSVEDDRYTATIVEIYDYSSAYVDNIDPIFISVPGDLIL